MTGMGNPGGYADGASYLVKRDAYQGMWWEWKTSRRKQRSDGICHSIMVPHLDTSHGRPVCRRFRWVNLTGWVFSPLDYLLWSFTSSSGTFPFISYGIANILEYSNPSWTMIQAFRNMLHTYSTLANPTRKIKSWVLVL